MFPQLNIPQAELRITKRSEQYLIWDVWRKKQVVLTPEEWVRQNLLHYLINHLNYPLGVIAVEMQIIVNALKRRCDAVVFDENGKPLMIIECKEPDVALSPQVMQQIAQYNFQLNTEWLLISNGLEHITLRVNRGSGTIQQIPDIPSFDIISGL